MYNIIRNILFLFDPEKVHYFSMNGLKLICKIGFIKNILKKCYQSKNPKATLGLNFTNPVGLGAGFDKNAAYLTELEMLGFGFVEIGTVTPKPQAGNEKPRLFRLPKDKALINRMGFNNDGVDIIANRLSIWRKNNPKTSLIIGGNIATREAYIRMSKYVDAAKVGIACGASCITYNKTGFASPMFSSVRDIAEAKAYLDKAPLVIADGGISSNGDIAKAFVAGADMVMCGSLFARCIDSPAVIDPADPTKKLYFGSASLMNGNKKNIEGKTVSLTINGMTYKEKLIEVQQDLASAVSYAGGNDLTAFKEVSWALL